MCHGWSLAIDVAHPACHVSGLVVMLFGWHHCHCHCCCCHCHCHCHCRCCRCCHCHHCCCHCCQHQHQPRLVCCGGGDGESGNRFVSMINKICACDHVMSYDIEEHVLMSCDSSHFLPSQDWSCLEILRTHSSPQECTPTGLQKLAGTSANTESWDWAGSLRNPAGICGGQ